MNVAIHIGVAVRTCAASRAPRHEQSYHGDHGNLNAVAAGSWLAILWADHAIDDEFVEPEEWLREELVLNDGEPLVIDYRH